MRIFGHPVHPLFVHFPTALLPMDLALSALYRSTGNASFYEAGAYCLWAGSALGLLSMIAGLIDLLAIPRSDKKATAVALYHSFVNGLLVLIFAVIAYKSWKNFPAPFFVGTVGVSVKGILVVVLFAGNYLGGRLIYNYRIGVDQSVTNGNLTT